MPAATAIAMMAGVFGVAAFQACQSTGVRTVDAPVGKGRRRTADPADSHRQ